MGKIVTTEKVSLGKTSEKTEMSNWRNQGMTTEATTDKEVAEETEYYTSNS